MSSAKIELQVNTLMPPFRYGVINPGLHRGAYPTLRNFRFLSRLQLKTIISFIPEQPSADLMSFTQIAGIKLIHFPLTRTAPLSDETVATLMSALNVSFILVHTLPHLAIRLCISYARNGMYMSNDVACFPLNIKEFIILILTNDNHNMIALHRRQVSPGIRALSGWSPCDCAAGAATKTSTGVDPTVFPFRVLEVCR